MSKKIKGEDGKVYVEKKPWYKRWWVWVIIAVAALFIIVGIANGGSDDSDSDSTASSQTQKNYVSLDGQKIYYSKYKKYKITNATDTSWPNATAKVNTVNVYKVDDGYTYGGKRGHKKVQGMLAVNVTVKAIKDIEVLMNSATISIPSINEQHDIETKEDWDNLDKGMSKTGTVYVPLYKLKNVNSIKSFRLKFDCQNQNLDDDDDNYDHTYDMTINLN